MKFDKIIVEKDCLWFGDTKVEPPFDREKIDALLGAPRIDEWDFQHFKGKVEHNVTCLWDELGIRADTDTDDHSVYKNFIVYVADGERYQHAATGTFAGKLMIGKKEYTKCKMKYDCLIHMLKKGVFNVYTFLIDELDTIDEEDKEEYKDCMLVSSRSVEIHYHAPKPKADPETKASKTKTSKYKLEKPDEPVLEFSSFNFKLMQFCLMRYRFLD